MVAMARKMLEKFDKYWGDCNLVIAFAAILDPRNKFTLVEHCMKDLYTQDNYTAHVQLIRQKLYDLYNEYVAEFNEKSVENPSEDGIDNAASTPSASVSEKKNTGRAKLDSLVEIIQSSTPTIMKSELDTYLEEKLHIAKNKSEFSVIEWWKDNRENYKILSQMACDIMAIPITSVASEAAFSTGGRVIDPSRASLGVKTVEALLCTQDWLRNHYSITNASKSTNSSQPEIELEIALP
ncbi:Zinc finger BED domain-containing protein RICESLEEPER 1 [Linum perenne]